MFSRVETPLSQNGYSIVVWIRIDGPQPSRRNLFTLLDESGAGTQGFIENCKLSFRLLPTEASGLVTLSHLDLDIGTWKSLAFVHTQSKLAVFLDGRFFAAFKLNYPNFQGHSVQVGLGGFHGDMGPFFLFGEAITASHVFSVFTSGPNFTPSYHQLFSGTYACFVPAVSAVARPNIKVTFLILVVSFYHPLLFCHACAFVQCLLSHTARLVAQRHSQSGETTDAGDSSRTVCVLSGGWDRAQDDCSRRHVYTDDCQVTLLANNVNSILSLGGLKFLFHLCSLEFRGSTCSRHSILSFLPAHSR